MPPIDPGHTAWLLVATALVMLMVPGLALFYGGMVQSKNVLSTLMHSMFALALITIQWVVIGYTLAFGTSMGGFVGGFDFAFLSGMETQKNGEIPALLFMMFQGMFAIITPALISGAYAERMKFSAYCVFTLLWATLVYDRWRTGCGPRAAGCSRRGRSTSPAAPSSISRPASRRWSAPWSSAAASATPARSIRRTT